MSWNESNRIEPYVDLKSNLDTLLSMKLEQQNKRSSTVAQSINYIT